MIRKYTKTVSHGLSIIDAIAREYESDKREEGDSECEEINAAREWIISQEQRAKRASAKRKQKKEEA